MTHEGDARLIRALRNPKIYDHEVDSIRVIETHISWVILTGTFAYKIKKSVRLPFVDFSTLSRRRKFCEEEVRLNQRLVPELYLGVVPIGGSIDNPVIGSHPAFEYAVKLREFSPGARLDERLAAGDILARDIRELAETIAGFHQSLPSSQRYSGPLAIRQTVLSNAREAEKALNDFQHCENLLDLADWLSRQYSKLEKVLADRRRQGAIRECHGDLHLENLAYWDGRIVAFDALEFDPRLRWIDVMDETAFLAMDLIAHERAGWAHELLNRYLELSGDYDGLEVFRFYLVHRAIVRAKVAAIKGSQQGASVRQAVAQVKRYLLCARKFTQPAAPLLLLTHGFSGSGKTSVTNELISRLPAIRCRSDLERKRLHGLTARAKSGSEVGEGLYTSSASDETYATLRRFAAHGLRARLNVIVDATFLARDERESFIQLGATVGSRVRILDCRASEPVLRQRIESRTAEDIDISEASINVLDHQLASCDAFGSEELKFVLSIETAQDINYDVLARRLNAAPPAR